MVMLGALKKKLGDDMAKPEIEVEVGMGGEGEEMGEEAMPEAKPVDLAAVSDDELLSEVKKRQLI